MSATYFIFDPFMVLRPYPGYDVSGVYLNESVAGWRTYQMHRDSLHYNSYIMGNSCTMGIRTEDWEAHLTPESRAIRLFDNSEEIGGVYSKLEALDRSGADIKNVFVVLDAHVFRECLPNNTFTHMLPPEASGLSDVQFHLKFLQGYLNPDVMVPYLHYKWKGEVTPYMERKCVVTTHVLREAYTNNGFHPLREQLKSDGLAFWKDKYWVLRPEDFSRKVTYSPRVIFQPQIQCLEKIREICHRHGADIKLIISPHYGLYERMDPADISEMKRVLGENSVFDLTGIDEFVTCEYDYYEPDHFRSALGKRILNYIYQNILEPAPLDGAIDQER